MVELRLPAAVASPGWQAGSRAQTLSSYSGRTGFNCPVVCGMVVLGPRTEPVDPVLAGDSLTTGPPGKSLNLSVF